MAKSITYLGHRIDAEGLHPLEEKVSAIAEAPAPKSVVELKAYLGLLTYYSSPALYVNFVGPIVQALEEKCTVGMD